MSIFDISGRRSDVLTEPSFSSPISDMFCAGGFDSSLVLSEDRRVDVPMEPPFSSSSEDSGDPSSKALIRMAPPPIFFRANGGFLDDERAGSFPAVIFPGVRCKVEEEDVIVVILRVPVVPLLPPTFAPAANDTPSLRLDPIDRNDSFFGNSWSFSAVALAVDTFMATVASSSAGCSLPAALLLLLSIFATLSSSPECPILVSLLLGGTLRFFFLKNTTSSVSSSSDISTLSGFFLRRSSSLFRLTV
mmetsp:Transcript_18649/g.37398  ORF Transcript_18649/g.37398 Transcript_18649/m.37398 type:complete len:247 (-) Transcript_18649:382-1122(-)